MTNFSDVEVDMVVQPCAAESYCTWIEIQMLGEDGAPIPYLAYRVQLPNGDIVRGWLDKNGVARVDDIATAGTCEVTFPELDSEAWR